MKRIEWFVRRSLCVLLLAAVVGAGCSEDATESSPNSDKKTGDASINRWMFDYMKTHYLWNEAVQQVTPNYSLGYEKFLDDILEKVAAQKDEKGRPVNYDDGYATADGWHFYSNIQRHKKSSSSKSVVTRGTHEQTEGLGIEMIFYASLNKDGESAPYVFMVAAVAPGSPAEKAGLQRGDLISRVDGSAITDDKSLNAGWNKLMLTESGTVEVTLYDMNTSTENREISITAASYDDNPVWKAEIFDCGAKKVGYLVYGSFNFYYDDKLIAAFSKFQNENIHELVIDLRYNGGGHVVSSAVLGTLVAGEAHRGEVYARTTYNASRKSEISDTYKLGEAQYNAKNWEYRHDPIATAIASAVGLSRIYVLCTENTASASELLINGLRGIGIEVRLIGTTTNGKNVGMEVKKKTFGDYEYEFSPITFYIANGKGESDYGDGFAPDVKVIDYPFYWSKTGELVEYHPLAWGDKEHDDLLFYALQWIETDTQPVPPAAEAETRSGGRFDLYPLPSPRVQEMILPER